MLKVLPSAKFPLKDFTGKGSYKERLEYAKILNAQFNELVQQNRKDGQITRFEYTKLLKNFIPNIKIKVGSDLRGFLVKGNAYLTPWCNNYDEVMGMDLHIPHRKNSYGLKVFDKKDDYISTHETFHLFASLANPKHTARIDMSTTDYNFYNAYIYTNLHKNFKYKERREWEKGLKRYLDLKSSESAINFLQDCRYRLIEENLAYKEGEKFSEKEFKTNKNYFFEEKVKIIEKLLYKTIKKARKENKQNKLSRVVNNQ